jgi:hypothetical protein
LMQSSAIFSVLTMGVLIVIQLSQDFETLRTTTLRQRITEHSFTSIELFVVWGIVGAGMYQLARLRRVQAVSN